MTQYIEDLDAPGVKLQKKLATNQPVDFSGSGVTSIALIGAPTAGGIVIPRYEYLDDFQTGQAASAWASTHTIYVADTVSGTWQVAAASATFGTASTSGTLQVEVCTGTQAAGSGTNQLTGTISLSGTANTAVNGTLIASPTTIAAGNRVSLVFGGTVTNLANCCVNVVLQRLS